MKNCTKCGPRNDNCFSKKKSSKDGLQSICKECHKKVRCEFYWKNKESFKKRNNINNAKYMKRNLQFKIDFLKQNPCIDCGEKDPIVLEFDHRKDKEYNVSAMNYLSLNKLSKEIAKCDVRCANCHRKKTAIQFGWYKDITF